MAAKKKAPTTAPAAPAPTKPSKIAASAAIAAALASNNAVSYRVADDFYLVRYTVATDVAPIAVMPPTHHVLWVDCSGSMWGEIERIRRHLKNKLATLVNAGDLVTLGWFSGPRECEVLFEGEPIRDLTDLARIHRAIDKLSALGATCFVDPIRMMSAAVRRVHAQHPQHVASGLFLSDGAHNCGGTTADVIRACVEAAGDFASFATVGYGWYAGMPLLMQMAEKMGGSAIQSEDLARFEPVLANALGRRPSGAKRVPVAVDPQTVGGFVFCADGADLTTYTVESNAAAVPADTSEVWGLSRVVVGELRTHAYEPNVAKTYSDATIAAAYAAVSLFGRRVQAKIVKPILRALGDVAMARQYSLAFGKPKTAAFADLAAMACAGKGRYLSGYDPNAMPRPDAFTVLDLLALLEDTGCRFFPDHPAFSYQPIGRGRLDWSDALTEDDLAALTAGSSADVMAQIEALKAAKGEPIKFVADPMPDGLALSGIVPNMEQPNLSMRVTRMGTIDLSSRIVGLERARDAATDPAEKDRLAALYTRVRSLLPVFFRTRITRTYAVVADGIVNVKALPVRLTKAAWDRLAREGIVSGAHHNGVVVLDLSALPVMNEAMIASLSAQHIGDRVIQETEIRAALKVLNDYRDRWFVPETSAGMEATYGSEVATWLREQGITDGGFSPKGPQAPARDKRMVRLLMTDIAGFSTEPKVSDVIGRMDGTVKGKQPAFGVMMEDTVREVRAFLTTIGEDDGPVIVGMAKRDTIKSWLDGKIDALETRKRSVQREIAGAAFTAIVGPAWFVEWGDDMGDIAPKDADKGIVADKTMTITSGRAQYDVRFRLREKEIDI